MSHPSYLVPPNVKGLAAFPRRLAFGFGRRFYLLLLIGLIWLAPAWFDAKYLYALAAWDIAVCALWARDLARLPKRTEIECRRLWAEPLQLSVEAVVAIELHNSGNIAIEAQVFDNAPTTFVTVLPELHVHIPAGATAIASYRIRPSERGDKQMGSVFLRYLSGWQLAEKWAEGPLSQTVRVYPNIEESKRDTIYLIRSRQIAVEMRRKHLRGHGREFESLREYRQGDEMRDISWTATARRGKPVTKAYQIERSQTVWLVLDAGRLLRARVLGLSKLDYSVGAALSLAQVAMYSGDKVAMLAYGRRVQHRLGAGRGPAHLRSLIDALALVHGEEYEADHLRVANTLLTFQKRRSLVVWLTDLAETAATPDVIESASRLAHRHLVLFSIIGNAELRRLVSERPSNPREMYRYVAGQEIMHRRDVLLSTLRQQGPLTMEVEPSRLSAAVVNQYLEIKERSLI